MGAKTLAKRLHERGYLRSIGTGCDRVQVRRTLQGARRNVLHLAAGTLIAQESAQTSQSSHGDEEPTAQSQTSSSNGPILGDDFLAAGQESARETGPIPAPQRSTGTIGPIGTVFST